MMVRKAVAGSVLGVGLTAMAIGGAGSAFASTDGGHGESGKPGSSSVTNINSYNTKTVTVTKDDHSVNLALFSGNTVTLKVVALNGNLSGNKLFSGNRVPILNGNKLFSGNRFPIITPPPA